MALMIFSSSAAVYGMPPIEVVPEDTDCRPINPYGETKRTMERMMHWVGLRHGIRYVSLRYFNVAGAREDGTIGEDHRNETHLVPIILQVPLGRRAHVTVYGDDYPTPDGTCIRDYVHVSDLADAHLRALDHLRAGGEGGVFNLGSGEGYSVRATIDAARAISEEMRPRTLDLGLEPALRQMLERLRERCGLEVAMTADGSTSRLAAADALFDGVAAAAERQHCGRPGQRQ